MIDHMMVFFICKDWHLPCACRFIRSLGQCDKHVAPDSGICPCRLLRSRAYCVGTGKDRDSRRARCIAAGRRPLGVVAQRPCPCLRPVFWCLSHPSPRSRPLTYSAAPGIPFFYKAHALSHLTLLAPLPGPLMEGSWQTR